MSGISVLVVDDEPLAREGLALRLAEYENITVLAVSYTHLTLPTTPYV